MQLSPIDIQQQQFAHQFRGLAESEVRGFLDLVAEQTAALTRENTELRREMRRKQRELEEHREREATLREAMLTAQRAIEEIREGAQKEAQLVVSESELRAEKIVHAAHARVTRILEDVAELKRQRLRLGEELRGTLQSHIRMLEVHEEQVEREHVQEEASVTVLQKVRAPKPPLLERDMSDGVAG